MPTGSRRWLALQTVGRLIQYGMSTPTAEASDIQVPLACLVLHGGAICYCTEIMGKTRRAPGRYDRNIAVRRRRHMASPSRKRKSDDAQITVGEGWRQFAFDRDDVSYLGVIRRGMEIGALAQDQAGTYVQVNGDMRRSLNKSRVESLLKSARVVTPRAPIATQPSAEQRAAVVVVVKPRRKVIVRDQ